MEKMSPIKAVSSINTENIIFYRTLCNRLSLRINPPIAINNKFYLKWNNIDNDEKILHGSLLNWDAQIVL